MKLAGSEMVHTRLCTKSYPDTVCSLLRTRSRGRSTPPARTQALCGCCRPWRAHTGEQSWLEGGEAGRHRDKRRMVEGRRASHHRRQIPPHPWLRCRWKEDACVREVGGLFRNPHSARHGGSPDPAGCYSWGFSSCRKDTSSLRPSTARPGSEGAAISQPTESLQTVSTWVTSSPPEAQGQPGPAICEQLLPALRGDAGFTDAAHKARKSQAKSTRGA